MKLWYQSWTIWTNIAGIAIIVLQFVLNTHVVVDPELQAVILAVLNLLLRFKTDTGVRLTK